MENASKALIMAGGILIGVLLISLAVYLFIDFGSTSAEINAQNAQKQLTEFNSKFTSYQNYENITIYDIITLAGYAKENNEYYGVDKYDDEYYIDVYINRRSILGESETQLISKNKNSDGSLTKFRYKEIDYHKNGRVKSITFQNV